MYPQYECRGLVLLLLLLNVFDDAPVCRRVTDESWAQARKLKLIRFGMERAVSLKCDPAV